MLKLTLIVPFLFACTPRVAANEEPVIPPDIWKIKQATNGGSCINLTGEYSLWGETAPQTPSTFRKWMPLSLDVMTGIYVSYHDRRKISYVRIDHQDAEITLTFFMEEGIVLTQKKIRASDKIHISCEADRVTINKFSLETKGEATKGTADIFDTYFLSDDGSLIIHKVIKRVDNILFLFKKHVREEYLVRFKAIERK